MKIGKEKNKKFLKRRLKAKLEDSIDLCKKIGIVSFNECIKGYSVLFSFKKPKPKEKYQ